MSIFHCRRPLGARRLWTLSAAASLSLTLAACGGQEAEPATDTSTMAVTTAPVVRRELASAITASGPVTAIGHGF